jgi:hypothetical protein
VFKLATVQSLAKPAFFSKRFDLPVDESLWVLAMIRHSSRHAIATVRVLLNIIHGQYGSAALLLVVTISRALQVLRSIRTDEHPLSNGEESRIMHRAGDRDSCGVE